MKYSLKRVLACVTVLTLLVTCAVSGMVLPASATAATGTNLLTNGDFESGTTGWETVESMVKEGIGFGGSVGLEFDTHGYSSFATYTEDEPFALDANSTYRITYRCHGTPTCIYRAGTYSDVSAFNRTVATKDYDGRWITWVVYFTTGADPVLNSLRFGRTSASTTGSNFIDDLTLEKMTPETNQIVGGDFESDAAPWWNAIVSGCGMERVADPIVGESNTVAYFTKDASASYYNVLRLRPGRRYQLTFRHYGANLAYQIDKTVGIDSEGNALGKWLSTGAHNDGWETVTFVFDTYNQQGVTTNGAYQFCFGVANGAYIDDVVLKELPATDSLILDYTELSLRTGKRMKLNYTLTPADAVLQGGALSWSTSNADVVQVTSEGEIFVRGNAGQSATVTVSNPCMSASCVITVPTNDAVVDAFFADTGIGDYTVSRKNYDGIIGAEERYAALTDAQREYISELLPVDRDYPDLLTVAKEKQSTFALEFAEYYSTNAKGAAYTTVTFENCLWIATAEAEWTAMSDSTKALINAEVLADSGMTFDAMLDAALELVPITDPNDRPGGAVTGGDASEPEQGEGDSTQSSTPETPESTVEPGVITPSSSTTITLSGEWLDEVTIPEYAYSIAVVGDTQVVTDRSPEGLKTLYDWILDNKDSKNIQFVAGLGDITETNSAEQWQLAAEQILRLKGEIPFSVIYGNHDIYNGSTAQFNAALPVDSLFEGMSSDRYGVYEEGCSDNTYQLFEVGEVKYLLLALEFGPSPDVLAWAGEVCDAYPDRNVILTTHAYLDGKGYVMDLNHSGSPHLKGGYETTYGTTIWEELVSTHDNIVLTFSGHVTADKAMTRQEIGKYGQVVTQTVSNPQTIDDQKMLTGMVTMLYFSEDGTQMTVSDYSTIQGKYYGTPYTVTVDKAQHRHKASTDVWSSDEGSHWYACACGAKADEAPHAFTAWELTETDGVQQRMCAICEYVQELTVPALYTEVELHRAASHTWSYDDEQHWLTCSCGEENVHMGEHNWTAWEKTGEMSSTASIFTADTGVTLSGFADSAPISNAVGTLDPNENTLAAELGDTLAAEIKANIIADFEKDGDKMVHVSSFTIIDGMVYMTYYANTATAAESAAFHEARFAYCPIDDPSDMTILTIQKVGDRVEGQQITMLYDTILMNKDTSEIYIMWTAKTSQYYRFYSVFDVATGTIGPIRVNRFKVGDVTNDFSMSGIKMAMAANNLPVRYMLSDIGIMQKLSTRVEDGVTWYYTGAYSWQFNCIIKSKDLITWEYVAAPDFDNQSEYENATYVVGDKVYYFVRQYDGNSTDTKCTTGFLTYYDLVEGTWAAPLEIVDCQSRSDFIYYGGQLYLIHAPKNRNGIGIVRVDQENIANSEAVIVADMASSCFYPFVKVYGDEAYISYTVNRLSIRLSKFDLTNYFESDGSVAEELPETTPDYTEEVEIVNDLDVWERFCPCGASEMQTLPMNMPAESDAEDNLIYGKIDAAVSLGVGVTTETRTVAVDLKAGTRYALRVVTKGTAGKVAINEVSGCSITTAETDNWRIYQYLFTPTADLTEINIKVTKTGSTRLDAVNFQILEAPQDGTFNLFPGADMSVENVVFATKTSGLGPVYDAKATHEVDPTDSSNTVLKLSKGQAAYFQINNALKGFEINEDMYIEITFRRTGGAVRLRKNWGATFPTYIGDQEAATETGVWETYTYYVAPGSSDLIYGSGAWGSQHISFYPPSADAYIDDIIIREVPCVESVSFKEGTVKVPAASGAHDISDQLVITPATACPLDLQNLTWSLAGGTTNKYDSTAKTFTGEELEAVTMSGTTVTLASLSSNGGMNDLWSLANVKSTVTVTVSENISVSAPIEWVYPETVFNIDVDTNAPGRKDTYEVAESDDSDNLVMSLPTATEFTDYFTQDMFLKPNARYLLSYRSKTVEGDQGRVYAYLSTQTGIYQMNTTNKPILISNRTTGEWITNTMLIETGDQPATDKNYSLMFQRYGAGTNNVLVDDFRLAMVPDDSSVVVGGDFELDAPTMSYYDKIIRNGFGTVVEGSEALGNTTNVLRLEPGVTRGSTTAIMALDYLKKNTVYKVSFRHKGDAVMFHVAGGDGWAYTINNVGSANTTFAATDTWTTQTLYFATGSAITNSSNWSSAIQIGTPSATEAVYLDDIVFTEIAAPFVQAVSSSANRGGSISLTGGGSSGKLLSTVKPGDTVRVTVTPSSGYMVDPGSVTYTTVSGTTKSILNKSLSQVSFGGGDGLTYEFIMPEEAARINATFVSAASTSFGMDTVGTSIRAKGTGYDGIRFLTRLYFADGFDASSDTLTVTYNDAEYEVIELGSLLKRAENATELTVANVEASTATGADRMWQSVAYTKGGNMHLVDYTDSYIDMSVVMIRGDSVSEEEFNARSYTARGYMKLQAADGTVVTVECDTELTNSIKTVAPLL